MITKSNETLVRRYVEDVWNKGQIDLADELLTPDHVRHDPFLEHDIVGIASVKKQIKSLRLALPDLHFKVGIYPASDGLHVTRKWTMSGTHEGEWMGFPPTGAKIINTGMALSHILDGKINEEWIQRDDVGLRRQIRS